MATVLKKVGGARTPHPETERQSRDASPREPQRRGGEAVEGVHPCARGGKRGEERLSRDVSVFETAVSAGRNTRPIWSSSTSVCSRTPRPTRRRSGRRMASGGCSSTATSWPGAGRQRADEPARSSDVPERREDGPSCRSPREGRIHRGSQSGQPGQIATRGKHPERRAGGRAGQGAPA